MYIYNINLNSSHVIRLSFHIKLCPGLLVQLPTFRQSEMGTLATAVNTESWTDAGRQVIYCMH